MSHAVAVLLLTPRALPRGAAWFGSFFSPPPPYFFASTCVIAAVSVVFPWSTCPIVPTFTCGLVRSNLLLAINFSPAVTLFHRCRWCGLNARPLPYQGSALPLSYNGEVRFDKLAPQK